jgi:TonB family protein
MNASCEAAAILHSGLWQMQRQSGLSHISSFGADVYTAGAGKPTTLYKEKAKCTKEARRNHVQGSVMLSAIFTADGQIVEIRVVRGLPDGLTERAIEAAQRMRFQPATRNGVPVNVRANLEFTFALY